jgi:hypothetical protein
MLTLEWSEPKTISRINIYDRVSTSIDFKNAYIRYFNTSNTLVASGLLRNIPDNGSITGSGFSPLTGIKRIVISGSGSVGSSVGLSEVAVFEDKSPYLTYLDSGTTKLHQNDFFQISTQIALSGRSLAPNDLYSVFHNIGAVQGSRFSGINLYLSGNRMNLDFATRRTNQNINIASTSRSISIPWNNDELRPIHLICSGGQATGTNPTLATAGYIRLSDGIENDVQYVLASQSGEYFHFKNSSYQSGINTGQSGLKFGLNDWQFPTGTTSSVAVPPARNPSQITNFIKVHSPIKYAQMAIWTGVRGINARIEQYSEIDFLYKRYDEISFKQEITGGLLGWWDMDVLPNGTIEAENNPANQLKVVTGDYNYTGFESFVSKDITTKTSAAVVKQNDTLPFGGFPGTEQYG